MKKNNPKQPRILWEEIEFSPYEWFLPLYTILLALSDIDRYQPKTSKWRMKFKLFKVDRKGKPSKSGKRYKVIEEDAKFERELGKIDLD